METPKYPLNEKDQENMDAFLGTVLDDYKAGEITKEQAVGGLTHIVAAIESGNCGDVANWFRQELKFRS